MCVRVCVGGGGSLFILGKLVAYFSFFQILKGKFIQK